MYAEFATPRLIDFLRASNYYNLETVHLVFVPTSLILKALSVGVQRVQRTRPCPGDGLSFRSDGKQQKGVDSYH